MKRNGAAPRYVQIAEQLVRQIERGTYRAGDAVPSIRAGGKLFQVSAGTLLEAYRHLEDRGYIQARPQSGYYVRSRMQLDAPRGTATASGPQSVHVNLAVEMLRKMGEPQVLQLGAAAPDPSLMPSRALNLRLARAVRLQADKVHAYGPVLGLPVLRQRLARWMSGNGCTLTADDLLVTNGCTEALNLCLRAVTRPGDVVAIESPAYYGLLIALKGLGLHALPIETSPVDGLSVAALEQAARRHRLAAVVVTPSFANPTGSCMPEAKRRELVAWSARAKTPIVEDDIYGELHFASTRPTPLLAFDTQGWVMYCSSTSKTISPGLRLGWCAPGRFFPQVEELKASVNPTSSMAPQYALADFLQQGGVQKHLRRLRRQYREQIERVCNSLTQHMRVPIRLHVPSGGHLLWVELPPSVDAEKIFHQAIAKKISIAPGTIFSPVGQFRHYMRLNCGVPWSPKVDRAIQTLSQIIDAFP